MSNHQTELAEFVASKLNTLGPPPSGQSVKSKSPEHCYVLRRMLRPDGTPGPYSAVYEYYAPESHDDDDLSYLGYLPARPGLTRVSAEWRGDTVEALVAALEHAHS